MRSAFTVAMAISMLSIGQGLKMSKDKPPTNAVSLEALTPMADPNAWLTPDMGAVYKDAEELQKEYPDRRVFPNASENFLMIQIVNDGGSCEHNFQNAAREMREGSRQEKFCLAYDVLPIEGHPNRFRIHSVFENPGRLRLHLTMPYYRQWYHFRNNDNSNCVVASKNNIHETAFKQCDTPLSDNLDTDFGCPNDHEEAKSLVDSDAWLTVDMKAYHKDVEELQKEYPDRRVADGASEDFLMIEIVADDKACEDQFWNAAREMREGSRQEKFCYAYDVLPIEGYPNRFMIHSVFENPGRLRLHLTMPYYRQWYHFRNNDNSNCVVRSKNNIHETAFKRCDTPISDNLETDFSCPNDYID